MPFVRFSLSDAFSDDQAAKAAAEMGANIKLLAGKDESKLMLDFRRGGNMFFRGAKLERGAFVECHLYGAQPHAEKKAFSEAVYKTLAGVFGIATDNIFMTYSEFDEWGSESTLKTRK